MYPHSSIYLSIYLSIYPSIYPHESTYLSLCLSIHTHLSIYLSISLSIRVYLSVCACLSTFPIYISTCLSKYLSAIYLSTHPYQSTYLSIHACMLRANCSNLNAQTCRAGGRGRGRKGGIGGRDWLRFEYFCVV